MSDIYTQKQCFSDLSILMEISLSEKQFLFLALGTQGDVKILVGKRGSSRAEMIGQATE